MGRLTGDDITQIIKAISATYPYAFKGADSAEDRQSIKALWLELLGGYPKEVEMQAFHNCLKTEKVNIVPANIIEQIEKMQASHGASEQELWQEFSAILNSADDLGGKFKFTMLEPNGKTQGDNARAELQALYENMREEFKRYCGSSSGLLQLARMDDEALEFERARFLKDIRKKQAEIRLRQESPALYGVIEKAGLLEGKI